MSLVTPTRDSTTVQRWAGSLVKKPWDYKVCAAIPVIDSHDTLKVVVELLRNQTLRPYILVVDTGSTPENFKIIDGMRAEDLEIHSLRLHGTRNPADYAAMALDLAMTLCRSPYLLITHSDCFFRRFDLIDDLVKWCKNISPVVGYEITPRSHNDWQGMVSYTCTMLDMKVMDKIGAGWSLRRLANLFDIDNHEPNENRPTWPDTELLLNYLLQDNKIEPFLIGKEENFCRNIDVNIDHCRGASYAFLYNPDHYKDVRLGIDSAIQEATKRLKNCQQYRK